MKTYFELFFSFLKIGMFTFGGGYAMLPLLQKEVVGKGWATDDELLDYYAIGQVTPGIIAINVSTFIGYKHKGILGAVCTMFGMILPSILIISSLVYGLVYIWENSYIQHAFAGMRLMITALLLSMAVKMVQKSVFDLWTLFILIISFVMVFFGNVSIFFIVIFSCVTGIILIQIKRHFR